MADNKPLKISQLPPSFGSGINDSDIIAASRVTGTAKLETQKVSIGELRKLMDYGNAFISINEAIKGSVDGQQFYVFVDDSKEFVYRYMNMGGIPSPVLGADGEPIKEPTTTLIKRLATVGGADGFGLIGTVTSFESLRALKPRKEGWRVNLAGYYEGSTKGSGIFVAKSGNAPDDNGFIAKSGTSGIYWERQESGDLNPFMFGAKGDFDETTQKGTDDADAFISAVAAGVRLGYRNIVVNSSYKYRLTKTINPGGVGYNGREGCAILGGSTVNTKIFFEPSSLDHACFELVGGSGIHTGKEVSGFIIQPVKSSLFNGTGIRYAGACFIKPRVPNIIMKFNVGLHITNDKATGVFSEFNDFISWRLHFCRKDLLIETNKGDNSFHGNNFQFVQIQVKQGRDTGDGDAIPGIGIEIRGVDKPAYWYNGFLAVHLFGGPGCIGMNLSKANTDNLTGSILCEGDLIFKSEDVSSFELAGSLRSIGKITFDVPNEPTTGNVGVYVFDNRTSNEAVFSSTRLKDMVPKVLPPSWADRTNQGTYPGMFRATKNNVESLCYATMGAAENRHYFGYVPAGGNMQNFIPGAYISYDGGSFVSYAATFFIGNATKSIAFNDSSLSPATTSALGLGQTDYRWSRLYTTNVDIDSNGIVPIPTNTIPIGSASRTFKDIFLQNAPTVVSDKEAKDEVDVIPDKVITAWSNVNFSQWKLKTAIAEKGDGARLHVGVIAQDIAAAFKKEGLDATEYGILIVEVDEEDNELWMVRMEECLILEAALVRRRLDAIESLLKKK